MQIVKQAFLDRRQFMINSGWLAAGVTMLASCSPIYSALPALPSTDNPNWAEAVTWIQVLPDGTIRFYCPRMEMGQGAVVGLSQVVAEELNVGSNEIECIRPNTQNIPRFKMTVGSESISNFFDPVSRASASIREVLRRMAMEKTNFELSKIKDARGGFLLPDGQRLGYAMLVENSPKILKEEDIALNGDDLPRYALKKQGKYQEIGRNWKHHELEAIITGKPLYARDASVLGMLYGQVLRPPAYGAKLVGVEGQPAISMPGVVAVVIDIKTDFVGVVVQHPSQLIAALGRIKIKWSKPINQSQRSLDQR
ncbi:MAG: molybdopterin-dependent oxidoreductase, partial [Rhodospirillales bacterium]|nr:molybdopterin-dependent oxidoreductase [Rhodospirillales bacterium]